MASERCPLPQAPQHQVRETRRPMATPRRCCVAPVSGRPGPTGLGYHDAPLDVCPTVGAYEAGVA